MNEITNEIAKAVRRKRADLKLTKSGVYKSLGISFKTYKKIETGNCQIKNSVYQKITQWLVQNY